MHQTLRKTIPALVVAGIAVTTPLIATGAAHATVGNDCSPVKIEHRVGNGDWVTDGRMSQPNTKISVRIAPDAEPVDGCEYKVSLASYSTEGPTWATSGTQVFLGWDTTTLDLGKREATLDVSAYLPPCFGQIDLYGTDVKHDGKSAPLPKYPNGVFPHNLITAWNGGTACAPKPTETPSLPTGTPTTSAPATPPTDSPSPSATKSAASPSASASASASKTPTATKTPSASASSSVVAAVAAGPVGTPVVAPVSAKPAARLASTGTDGSKLMEVSIGGAALLAAGAGAVVFSRRRAAKR